MRTRGVKKIVATYSHRTRQSRNELTSEGGFPGTAVSGNSNHNRSRSFFTARLDPLNKFG